MPTPLMTPPNPAAVVAAAASAGADFLHPGYGFLSERAALARACAAAGIVFVGPSPETLELCGDKIATRQAAARVGVPVPAASPPLGAESEEWPALAAAVGYPLLVKAAGGGGGASLRQVDRPEDLAAAVASSRREAEAAGAGGVLYLERLLPQARHIEVQVAGDGQRAIAIGERECSLQRRHQKVIEEAPAANLPEPDRGRLFAYAVAVAEAVGLRNLATIEFLYGQDGTIAFIEVNPRLQVEHPVTELVSGLDLVALQLDLAAGGQLPASLPAPRGHAVEARLYAEDPAREFLPSPGPLAVFAPPELPGLRVDAGYQRGDRVPEHYDPLLAKLVGSGATRVEALDRLRDALARTGVAGVATNRAWLLALLDDTRVREGRYDTLTAEEIPAPSPAGGPEPLALGALAAAMLDRPPSNDPWDRLGPFRLDGAAELAFHGPGWERVAAVERQDGAWQLAEDGRRASLAWWHGPDGLWTVRLGELAGRRAVARHLDGTIEGAGARGRWLARPGRQAASQGRTARRAEGTLRAPLPGKVLRVEIAPGERVSEGQPLVILSAMKLEVVLRAPFDGTVRAVHGRPEEQVEAGAVLVELEPEAEDES
ncbi:MAG TPA: biotin carboxylase N-terminal domain-containing protein [Nitrolancea sp.]|nr:biotin carboxylase N-terminal domain-containing protein [Nitrolancea sp.]